jgi:hypothetical protein
MNKKLTELEKTLRIAKLIRDGDKVNAEQISELSTSLKSLESDLNTFLGSHSHEPIDKALQDLAEDISALYSFIDEVQNSSLTEKQVSDLIASAITQAKDGKDGRDGRDGNDGVNGLDGKDADEDSIVSRVLAGIQMPGVKEILGDEIIERINTSEKQIDRDRVKGLDELEELIRNTKKGVTLFGGSTSSEELFGKTFEAVSKNLNSYPFSLTYTGDNLTSVVYTTPRGAITKTLAYTGDDLTSVVISGALIIKTPITKTLAYTSGNLSSVAYS